MRKSIVLCVFLISTFIVSSFYMLKGSNTIFSQTSNFTLANVPDSFYSPPPPIVYKRFDSGNRPFAVAGSGFQIRRMQKLLRQIKRLDSGIRPSKLNFSNDVLHGVP